MLWRKVVHTPCSKDELIGDIRACDGECWGVVCMRQHWLWAYLKLKLILRFIVCQPCTTIGKNLNSLYMQINSNHKNYVKFPIKQYE